MTPSGKEPSQQLDSSLTVLSKRTYTALCILSILAGIAVFFGLQYYNQNYNKDHQSEIIRDVAIATLIALVSAGVTSLIVMLSRIDDLRFRAVMQDVIKEIGLSPAPNDSHERPKVRILLAGSIYNESAHYLRTIEPLVIRIVMCAQECLLDPSDGSQSHQPKPSSHDSIWLSALEEWLKKDTQNHHLMRVITVGEEKWEADVTWVKDFLLKPYEGQLFRVDQALSFDDLSVSVVTFDNRITFLGFPLRRTRPWSREEFQVAVVIDDPAITYRVGQWFDERYWHPDSPPKLVMSEGHVNQTALQNLIDSKKRAAAPQAPD